MRTVEEDDGIKPRAPTAARGSILLSSTIYSPGGPGKLPCIAQHQSSLMWLLRAPQDEDERAAHVVLGDMAPLTRLA